MAISDFEKFVRDRLDEADRADALALSSVVCLAAPGTPTIYVSPAFEAHTGYAPVEAIGRNLSFLQGPATEPEAVARFRRIIATGTPGTVRITNYRKDGRPFAHVCEVRPVLSPGGALTHFVAVQRMADG